MSEETENQNDDTQAAASETPTEERYPLII